MTGTVRFLIRAPKLIIAVTLLLTAVFFWQAQQGLWSESGGLRLDTSFEPFISRDSGAFSLFKTVRDVFGNEEVLVIALQRREGKAPNADTLQYLQALSDQIRQDVPHVNRLSSLLTVPQLSGPCAGKSYWHEPVAGSVCESIWNRYQQDLACLQNPEWFSASQISDSLLDEGLDDEPDFEEFSRSADEIQQEVPFCAPDLLGKDPEQLRAEFNRLLRDRLPRLAQDPLITGDVLSADFSTLALLVQFSPSHENSHHTVQQKLMSLLENADQSVIRLASAGASRTEYQSSQVMQKDILTILPFSFMLIIFSLYWSFKNIRGVIIPISVVLIGLIWTFGLFSWWGERLNLVTIVLAPLLISVGSAYIIHVLNQFFIEVKAHPIASREKVVQHTLEQISMPLMVTALTTLAGFSALMTSALPAVSDLGLYASVGILCIAVLSLLFVPALLLLLPLPTPESRVLQDSWLDLWLKKSAILVSEQSKRFTRLWILVGIIAFSGLLQVQVNSDTSSFPESSPLSQDLRFIEQHLAGSSSFRVVLSGENLLTSQTLQGLEKVETWLLQAPELKKLEGVRIDKMYSPVAYLKAYRGSLDDLTNDEIQYGLEQLRNYDGPLFVSPDQQMMQFSVRLKLSGSSHFLHFQDLLDQQLRQHLPHLKAAYTGGAVLTSEAADNIATGQIQSVFLALVVIFIILSILFMSLKMGLIALYPNIVTILVFFGLLGWFDIPVGVTISVIASIALGIGVDDTIHSLSHYNTHVKRLRSEKEAAMLTIRQTGKAMIFTTFSLCMGFVVFVMSDMQSQVLFGLLTAFTLLVCLLADINFLPSILMNTKVITVWDYASLHYDQTFLEKILLFRDMTLKETKIAMLMAYTTDLEQGEVLFQAGDQGAELFVVLSGEIEIYLEQPKQQKRTSLVHLGCGRIFGEMGPFRKSARSTNAMASQKTTLLILNDDILDKLQRRYPLVAAKLYMNLSRNLANTIQRTRHQVMLNASSGLSSVVVPEGAESIEVVETVKEQVLCQRSVLQTSSKYNIFRNMTQREFNWLINVQFECRDIPAGARLFSQGDYADYVLVILSGEFQVSIEQECGRTLVVGKLRRGEMLGEMALIGEAVRHRSAVATENSRVLYISINRFVGLFKKKRLAAKVAWNMVWLLSNHLEQLNIQLIENT